MWEIGAIIEGSHGISQSDEKAYTCYSAFRTQRVVSAGYGRGDHAHFRSRRMDSRLILAWRV